MNQHQPAVIGLVRMSIVYCSTAVSCPADMTDTDAGNADFLFDF